MQKKFKTGIVIGRFQPFHKGHKYLIEKALEYCDRIFIMVAAADLVDKDNPYSSKKREMIVKKFVEEEGLGNRVIDVFSLNNHPDDKIWLENLLKITGKIDVTVGDNEWVNGIFEDAGMKAIRIGYHKRELLEGKKIRDLKEKKGKWEKRVPHYLVKHISSNE